MGITLKSNLLYVLAIVGCMSSTALASEYLYKAKQGDNLWNITEQHLNNMDHWFGLNQLNNLPDANYIAPGTVIRIPENWLVKKKAKARLIYTTGDVEIIFPNLSRLNFKDEAHVELATAVELTDGVMVKTGQNGLATIMFEDESKLLLHSDSELFIEGLALLGDGSLNDMKMRLGKGSISNDIKSDNIHDVRYEVKTPFATTSVRGTEFRLNVNDEKKLTIAEVLRGKIVFSSLYSGKNFDLGKGLAAVMNADGKTIIKSMPKAPYLNTVPAVIERASINIELKNIADVVGYHTVILDVGNNFNKSVSTKNTQNKRILSNTIKKDGHYRMLVSAIDSNSIMGEEAARDFILNAYPIPPAIISPQEKKTVFGGEINFKWTKNFNTKTYQLLIAKDIKFQNIVLEELTLKRPEHTLKFNLPAGDYYWKVASTDHSGDSGPFSDPIYFKVMPSVPNLDEVKVEAEGVTLRWTNVGEYIRYRVQIASDREFDNVMFGRILTQNIKVIPGLLSGKYYFRMQLVDVDGADGDWGLPQSFIIP